MHLRPAAVKTVGTAVIMGVLLLCPALAVGDTDSADWYAKMSEAEALFRQGQRYEALALYKQAALPGEPETLRADASVYCARAYEALRQRREALATYKNILLEYPNTEHAARICFRLGELHTAVTLLPEGAAQGEMDRLRHTEMLPEKGIPYFEQAVAGGPALTPWVLASRLYLARLYTDTGRQPEAWSILRELATLNLENVNRPDYAGPYAEMSAPQKTREEKVAEARAFATRVRHSARVRLVSWSVVPGDPIQSLRNLQGLMESYAGTEIESLARKEATAAQERMMRQLESLAAEEGVSVIEEMTNDLEDK